MYGNRKPIMNLRTFPEIIAKLESLKGPSAKLRYNSVVDTVKKVQESQRVFLPYRANQIDETNLANEQDSPLVKRRELYQDIIYSQSNRDAVKFLSLTNAFTSLPCANTAGSLLIMIYLRRLISEDRAVVEAVEYSHALHPLLNMLQTTNLPCKLAALKLLIKMCDLCRLTRGMLSLGMVKLVINIMQCTSNDLKCLCSAWLGRVGEYGLGRADIIRHQGVEGLVLICSLHGGGKTTTPDDVHAQEVSEKINMCATMAVASCSKSPESRLVLRRTGLIATVKKNLASPCEAVVAYSLEILVNCTLDHYFRMSLRSEGQLSVILKLLSHSNSFIATLACKVLANCVKMDLLSRVDVRQQGGLEVLVKLLQRRDYHLLVSVAMVLFKCCYEEENALLLHKLQVVPCILQLLRNTPPEAHKFLRHGMVVSNLLNDIDDIITTNTHLTGCLYRMCKTLPESSQIFVENGGMEVLAMLLKTAEGDLTTNIVKCIGQCSLDEVQCRTFASYDVPRILFSRLRDQDPRVQEHSAYALCRYYHSNLAATMEINSHYVGALEDVLFLLRKGSDVVVTAICRLISVIGQNEQNLAVMNDLGLVNYLSNMLRSPDPNLQAAIIAAMVMTMRDKKNLEYFTNVTIVRPLCHILKTTCNEFVKLEVVRAMEVLSTDPSNARLLKLGKVQNQLMAIMKDPVNEEIMRLVGNVLHNIRHISYAMDNYGKRKMVK